MSIALLFAGWCAGMLTMVAVVARGERNELIGRPRNPPPPPEASDSMPEVPR